MKKIKCLSVLIFSVFLYSSQVIAQDVRINEVVSSNSVYLDEDGDSPDWIELHNYGATEVSLLNWGLTDDGDNLHDWQFPNITLQPDEYLLVWASGKDRSDILYSRTLVNQGDIHNYLIPNNEPSSNWNDSSFDDATWISSTSGFGYGDNDDATIVANGTKSIFTRIEFEMSSIDDLTSLMLDIDYDDGFVAYINGVEVARANMNGSLPAFDAGTTSDHEAKMYNGGTPDRFLIDNPNTILVEGTNILAIQVHNTSNTSSDLTLIPFLSATFSSPTAIGVTPPDILGLTNGTLHTNFKVSSKSETLFLSDPDENIVYQILVEGLNANASIGTSIYNDSIVFYTETTPGQQNSANEYLGIISSDIVFSHEGGMVNSAFDLTLSGNEGSQIIRYTTDATEPDETSTIYTSTISITGNSTIRARLFDTNFVPSLSNSKTYIFNANHQIDIVMLATDPGNLFDEEYGIYVYGDSYEPNVPYRGANFWEDWERPVHFSFYDKDTGELETAFNAGIKIFGGWSRAQDQRSFSIFARGQYGTSEIKYPFFDSVDYDEFQALVLRNSGNDWLNTSIRDAALSSLMEGTDLEFQAFNPVATYINGEYWGMYNLREKVNEHFLASKHNVDADAIDLLETNGQVVDGSNTEYNELINYVSTTDLSIDANFEYVNERVDVENYALYQATQIYFNNQDWPGNNIKFWKHPEGKWRWIMYDTDFGFGIWDDNDFNDDTLSFALEEGNSAWPNPDWSTLLFRNLIENTSFRNRFINRYADELNTRFLPANVMNHIESVFLQIEPEVNAHYTRWGGNPSDARFNVDRMKTFADKRPSSVKEHIKSQFNLPDYHELTITNTDISQGYVKVNNNLEIQLASWSGDYFETVPIELTARAEAGYQFAYWSGASTSTSATIELSLESAIAVTPNFIAAADLVAIVINEINYKSSDDFDPNDWVELYNPNNIDLDVSDYILKDDDDDHAYVFPNGTSIPAEGYLILTKKGSDFSDLFPDVENVIGDFDFGLGSSDDAVRIYNADEILQDEVYYTSESPWPECAKGQGQTLELISPDLDNSLPENWDCINEFGSPEKPNILVVLDALVINEINYKSGDIVDAGDWVELYNPNDVAINVSNWMLKDDDDTHIFMFPENTTIQAESYLVLIKDEADFTTAFPSITNFIGELGFGLGGSDAVRLYNADAVLEDEVNYDSEAPWPTCADGLGPTLELIATDLDNSLPENWDCINEFGSPNAPNIYVPVELVDPVIINEINYKSGDIVDAGDWVELYNPKDIAIDVSNYILKDDDDTHSFVFPENTMIEAKSFLVIVKDEADFRTAFPTITNFIGELGFGFGGSDAVRLYDANEILQDVVNYDSETPWPMCADGLGPTLELIATGLDNNLPENWDCINEFGSPNAPNIYVPVEVFDPLIINEINYKSGDIVDAGDWVELYNPNDVSIDVSNYILKDDDDTHSFVFPENTIIEANDYLVLVKDNNSFTTAFPAVTNAIGEFGFELDTNDTVRLYDAGEVLQDEVNYNSESPWPTCANGFGPTLELIATDLDNSLPESWYCINTVGSPGEINDFDESITSDMLLYPNPVSNILNISGTTAGEKSLVIYNVLGKVVLSDNFIFQVDVSSLTQGIYFVQISDGNSISSYKLIKN